MSSSASPAAASGAAPHRLVRSSVTGAGQERERLAIPLTELDKAVSDSWVTFCYRFDARLDGARLASALEDLVAVVPVLEAQRRRDASTNRLEFVVDGAQHNGVEFEEFRGAKGTPLPTESDPSSLWVDSKVALPARSKVPGPEDALMLTRLVVFEPEAEDSEAGTATSVSFLSVDINHGLGDADSMVAIVRLWAEAYSGVSLAELQRRAPSAMRSPLPAVPATDREALLARWACEVGSDVPVPFRSETLAYEAKVKEAKVALAKNIDVPPQPGPHSSDNTIVELVGSYEGMRQLKTRLAPAGAQEEEDTWVSSFEALMAGLLCAREASRGATAAAVDRLVHCAVNVREREPRFAASDIGNYGYEVPFRVEIDASGAAGLVATARSLHDALRGELARGGAHLGRKKEWRLAARALGLGDELQYPCQFVLDGLRDDASLINNWAKFDWLAAATFGDVAPRAYAIPPAEMQSYWLQLPRTKDTCTVFALLPSGDVARFWAYVAANALPISGLAPGRVPAVVPAVVPAATS